MSNRGPRVIVVGNDEVSRYQQEFGSLCDRLDVCDEIRDGYYSDEARLGDLFSFLDSAEAVAGRVAALELPGITRSSYLVIRINEQWRICFEWPHGSKGPVNVEIVDYH